MTSVARSERPDTMTLKERKVLQQIMQVLGPQATSCCQGCSYEINEAIRLLQSLGIDYHQRKPKLNLARAIPPLDASFLGVMAQIAYSRRYGGRNRLPGGRKVWQVKALKDTLDKLIDPWAITVGAELIRLANRLEETEIYEREVRCTALKLLKWVHNCQTVHSPHLQKPIPAAVRELVGEQRHERVNHIRKN